MLSTDASEPLCLPRELNGSGAGLAGVAARDEPPAGPGRRARARRADPGRDRRSHRAERGDGVQPRQGARLGRRGRCSPRASATAVGRCRCRSRRPTAWSRRSCSATGTSGSRSGTGGSEVLSQKRMPLPADHAADEGMTRGGPARARARAPRAGTRPRRSGPSGSACPRPSTPSPVRWARRGCCPGWRGVPVAAAMAEALGTKVAPRQHGQPRGPGRGRSSVHCRESRTAVFIKASYGVGAGLILGGELFRGSAGNGGRDRARDDRRGRARSAGAATAAASTPSSGRRRCSAPCATPTAR